ncbi:zinc finger protein 444-like [Labeo rohita]|uniref:Zinc finger protein 444-like n=1 Tax=Labeo rohita TaxID=84645 RepID=A0A498LJS8_LABRO|nr:zinc finger protein 444-like [Labeo rohita]
MWLATGALASTSHSTALRGGAGGGPTVACAEPPGLHRSETCHPPTGRPKPRGTPPAVPVAGAGQEQPVLPLGTTVPGYLPQVAAGRGRRRRADARLSGARPSGAVPLPRKTVEWVQCHRPTSLDLAIQMAEDQMVACPGPLDPLPAPRVVGKSGPACWRCGDPGHFIDRCPVMEVRALIRVLDAPQAASDQAGLYQITREKAGGWGGRAASSKLLAKWQGLFEVRRRIGDLNYEVIRSDRNRARQVYHLNLLKKWREEESVMLVMVVSGEDDLGPELPTRPQSLALALGGDHFSPSQLTDIAKLQNAFADMFSPLPGRTDLIQHHIGMELGVVVRSRPYRLPEYKKKVVQTELEAMLEMGVI